MTGTDAGRFRESFSGTALCLASLPVAVPASAAAAEELAAAYAGAAGYPYGKSFTRSPITGDATNWLAAQGIPTIIVELATHTSMEWPQNRARDVGDINSPCRTGCPTGGDLT